MLSKDLREEFESQFLGETTEDLDSYYIEWLEGKILKSTNPILDTIDLMPSDTLSKEVVHLNRISIPLEVSNAVHYSYQCQEASEFQLLLTVSDANIVLKVPAIALSYMRCYLGQVALPFGATLIPLDISDVEDCIAKSAFVSVAYSQVLLITNKNPKFPKGEEAISKDAITSVQYSRITDTVFPKGEEAISKNADLSLEYMRINRLKKFRRAEKLIAQNPYTAYEYAELKKGRFPLGEAAIARSARTAYDYASKVLRVPFPLGEHAIASELEYAMSYAYQVIGGPFPLGEPTIAKSAKDSYDYAKDIIEGRFPLGEVSILNNTGIKNMYLNMLDNIKRDKNYYRNIDDALPF